MYKHIIFLDIQFGIIVDEMHPYKRLFIQSAKLAALAAYVCLFILFSSFRGSIWFLLSRIYRSTLKYFGTCRALNFRRDTPDLIRIKNTPVQVGSIFFELTPRRIKARGIWTPVKTIIIK